MNPESLYEVVIIGGGQAGLATGHLLARQSRRFAILEAADAPAAAWRERWDSLRLFTPARYDALPGAPVHTRGVTAAPGLYFVGLPWQHARGSALLGWVEDDAEFIAGRIAALAAAEPAPGEAVTA